MYISYHNRVCSSVWGGDKTGNKETEYTATKKRAGVYLIKYDGIIVYVGMATADVVRVMYRHFYKAQSEYHVNYVDDGKYEVAVLVVEKEDAVRMEKALIYSLLPRDNKLTYDAVFEAAKKEVYEEIERMREELPF